jgi:DNA cross-link repair 1A protein
VILLIIVAESHLYRATTVNTPAVIEGVRVTTFDANHCPGALLLLFELPSGKRVLHCGDMRWCVTVNRRASAVC